MNKLIIYFKQYSVSKTTSIRERFCVIYIVEVFFLLLKK